MSLLNCSRAAAPAIHSQVDFSAKLREGGLLFNIFVLQLCAQKEIFLKMVSAS